MLPTRVAYGREAPARRHTFTQPESTAESPRRPAQILPHRGQLWRAVQGLRSVLGRVRKLYSTKKIHTRRMNRLLRLLIRPESPS